MDYTEELQPIVKEYLERQKDSNLTLCIYEEKASKDIEWIYDKTTQDWVYLKPKKIRLDKGEYKEGFIIEHKKFKTFGKKCHITEMSFFNFMALKASEYFRVNELTNDDVDNYISWYKEEKNKNPELSFSEINTILKERHKNSGCLLSILGFLCIPTAIILKLTGVI